VTQTTAAERDALDNPKTRFIYFLYRLALTAAFPFLVFYIAYRGLRNPRYFLTVQERFGFIHHSFQQTAYGSVWLHAVSVGEVLSCAGLLRQLQTEMPGTPLFVSVGTLAGYSLAKQRLAGIATGIIYAPFDYCFAVRALLRRIRPALLIVAETEIWPNLWRETRKSGAAVLVVNGRISDKAIGRYRSLRWALAAVLAIPNRIFTQSATARDRYVELGAPKANVVDGGNLKYDFVPPDPPAAVSEAIRAASPSHVWIAASTMPPNEDDLVLDAFQALSARYPKLLLVLVPRKPELFDSAAAKLTQRGITFQRRSQLGPLTLPGVLLVDTMGELASLFALADVVFMGGTIAPCGGHNVLEPAWHGKPVMVGPHMENFAEIAADFRKAGALVEGELLPSLERLLADPALCTSIGAKAAKAARQKTGATARAAHEAVRLASLSVPHRVRTTVGKLFAAPLTWLWHGGSIGKRRQQLANAKQLPVPVISIGGLSMGGAGKTPMAVHLAARLKEGGSNPGFLTRGYRRKTNSSFTVLSAGADAPIELTGDEAQILLRSRLGPVAIGVNRYQAGMALLKKHNPTVILLDDGFQHWRLRRNIDIVLIDALDPFAGGELFPAGRLREPLTSLARADAFILTRVRDKGRYDGIEAVLRRYNPKAPIYHSRIVATKWIDLATSSEIAPDALQGLSVGAFCGLGNPASFWRSVEAAGCSMAWKYTFSDHHRYRPGEVRRMASRARAEKLGALVTTEKDTMNLPKAAAEIIGSMPTYWLAIDVEIDREAELLQWIRERMVNRPAD